MKKHSKKNLVEVNPPLPWLWRQNGTTVVAVMILEVAGNWRSVFSKNILKKVGLWSLITFCYGNIYSPYNTWVAGVYMAYIFVRNSWRKPSQIDWLFESNLKSFSYFECSTALWILLDPAAKAACLEELAGCLLQAQIPNRRPN